MSPPTGIDRLSLPLSEGRTGSGGLLTCLLPTNRSFEMYSRQIYRHQIAMPTTENHTYLPQYLKWLRGRYHYPYCRSETLGQ